MTEDLDSLSPLFDDTVPATRVPNAVELALIAANVDPQLSRENPARAVDCAASLILAAQKRIDIAFHKEEEEATERGQRAQLFSKSVSIAEAYKLWPNDYTSEKRFRAALLKAGLIETNFGKDFETVEVTSQQAVAMLPEWTKKRRKELNRKAKKATRQSLAAARARNILEKNQRTASAKKGTPTAKNGTPKGKIGTRSSKKGS